MQTTQAKQGRDTKAQGKSEGKSKGKSRQTGKAKATAKAKAKSRSRKTPSSRITKAKSKQVHEEGEAASQETAHYSAAEEDKQPEPSRKTRAKRATPATEHSTEGAFKTPPPKRAASLRLQGQSWKRKPLPDASSPNASPP